MAGVRYLGVSTSGTTRSRNWLLAMDGGGERPTLTATSHKAPRSVPDGELVELLWQDGAVVAHSQAQAHHHHHHHHHRTLVHAGAGNTGASGVTREETHALPWIPACNGGAALGGDVYSQLWQSIAMADGRVVGEDTEAGAPCLPPRSRNSDAGSSRTAGQEVGSSFCGSNLALHLDDDIDDVGIAAAAALPMSMPLDEPTTATGKGAGASTSSGWNSNAPLPKRSRDEFDEDADELDAVDETPPSSRDRRPASSKRRTRAAEVHNMSERRRRDRINEKMRALQELVPHCNKTDKASILDEAIEYLKALQMQVQIMWMSTGMAPMMIPGAHQLMPPMAMGLNSAQMPPPAVQFLSQMQRVLPPFMNNPLPNQMPQILPPPTNAPSVTDQAQSNGVQALPRNPFLLHPNDNDALTTPHHHQVPSLFGYGPQMVQVNEIQEVLTGTAAPSALGIDLPSSSDGTGT